MVKPKSVRCVYEEWVMDMLAIRDSNSRISHAFKTAWLNGRSMPSLGPNAKERIYRQVKRMHSHLMRASRDNLEFLLMFVGVPLAIIRKYFNGRHYMMNLIHRIGRYEVFDGVFSRFTDYDKCLCDHEESMLHA